MLGRGGAFTARSLFERHEARGARGLCLEIHDLVASKYVASREKDREFVRVAIQHRLVSKDILLERLAPVVLEQGRREHVLALLDADFKLYG